MSEIIKLSPLGFIQKITTRGLLVDYDLSRLLTDIEKLYCLQKQEQKQKTKPRHKFIMDRLIYNTDVEIGYSSDNLENSIKLFADLANFGLNYIHFVVVMMAIDSQTLKNLYRQLYIEWNKVLIKKNKDLSQQTQQTENILENYLKEVRESTSIDDTLNFVVTSLNKFIECDKSSNNLRVVFIANMMIDFL
jgi:hypothetical protein